MPLTNIFYVAVKLRIKSYDKMYETERKVNLSSQKVLEEIIPVKTRIKIWEKIFSTFVLEVALKRRSKSSKKKAKFITLAVENKAQKGQRYI